MMKRIKYCGCGKYKPRSTKGIIDLKCANCGGVKKLRKIK